VYKFWFDLFLALRINIFYVFSLVISFMQKYSNCRMYGAFASYVVLKFYRRSHVTTMAVSKVRGLNLLLRVRILWRYDDGLFFEVPPLASDALLTTLHPLLENMLQTVCRKLQEDSGTGGLDFSCLLLCLYSASTTWKPRLVSLRRLHRLDGWVVWFQNSILQRWRSTKEIPSCSAVLKMVLLKWP
jgi:hypothetical protein